VTKPTLGVHLIVRNEEVLLPHCLESVSGADEIVIVDTGSTDRSIAIARSHGALVIEQEWTRDFSEARNAGLLQATTDWILTLDADEILRTPIEDITALLQNTSDMAFTVSIENWYGSSPEDRLHHRIIRLFRNGQGYRYSGKIHESVDPSIIARHGTMSVGNSSIEITHFGYLPEIMADKNKIIRNEELLRLALAEQPEDDFYRYNLAVTCCQAGRIAEAEELLHHTLSRVPYQVSYRPAMIRDLCKIYLSTGKLQQIDALLARELARYSDYPDLHYIQGQSWERQGLPERAYQAYLQAESVSESTTPGGKYVSEKGISTFRPLHRRGIISRKLGHWEEAARLFHQSLQHHSLFAPALQGIASAFQHLDVPDRDIAGLLMQLVTPEQAAGRAAIVGTLYGIGAYEAIGHLPEAAFPPEPGTLVWTISSLIISGKPDEARTALQSGWRILSAERAGSALLQQLGKLQAVCRWVLAETLQPEQDADIPQSLLNELLFIEERVLQKTKSAPDSSSGPVESPLVAELIRLCVELQCYPLGSALAAAFPGHKAELAAALYEAGRLTEAGELFIELVRDKQARGRNLRYIGEMIFDKGHYAEASGWFQQVIELKESPEAEAARIGLSLCYLHLAILGLEEALGSFKEDNARSPLLEDIAGIKQSIAALNRMPWHTEWAYHQRQRGSRP
jgi:glycosyltransferase involved in cell wall biosynthesis